MTGVPTTTTLRLRPLRLGDRAAIHAGQAAMAPDHFEFAFDLTADVDWAAYVQHLAAQHAGTDLAPDRVPASFLVAEVDAAIVGRVSIRHELNDWLLAHGGHIGYGVLPPHRGRGYATEILRQALVIARAHGVDRALVTCDDDNPASAAVIERCGGRRDPNWPTTERADGPPIRRYWIE